MKKTIFFLTFGVILGGATVFFTMLQYSKGFTAETSSAIKSSDLLNAVTFQKLSEKDKYCVWKELSRSNISDLEKDIVNMQTYNIFGYYDKQINLVKERIEYYRNNIKENPDIVCKNT